jgi:hypothetical protein
MIWFAFDIGHRTSDIGQVFDIAIATLRHETPIPYLRATTRCLYFLVTNARHGSCLRTTEST